MSNVVSTLDIYVTLEVLANSPDKDFSISDLAMLNKLTIFSDKMKIIVDSLHRAGYVTENWVVTDILDPDSKSELRYKITNNGIIQYHTLKGKYDASTNFVIDDNEDYNREKKKNKWLLIGFGIFFIIAIIIVVVVSL